MKTLLDNAVKYYGMLNFMYSSSCDNYIVVDMYSVMKKMCSLFPHNEAGLTLIVPHVNYLFLQYSH